MRRPPQWLKVETSTMALRCGYRRLRPGRPPSTSSSSQVLLRTASFTTTTTRTAPARVTAVGIGTRDPSHPASSSSSSSAAAAGSSPISASSPSSSPADRSSSKRALSTAAPKEAVVSSVLSPSPASSFQPPPFSSSSNPAGTFVSKYYSEVEGSEIASFLHRKELAFRENMTHLIVKECPFCEKPTNGRQDNMDKLYISREGGQYFCHRCGQSGSWFDFKRRLGSGLLPMPDSSLASSSSSGLTQGAHHHHQPHLSATDASASWHSTRDERQQRQMALASSSGGGQSASRSRKAAFVGKASGGSLGIAAASESMMRESLRQYQTQLMDQGANRHIRKWLTGNGPGERGLSPTVLRKYGVGCTKFSFPNEKNEFVTAECVVFPWMVPADPSSHHQEQLQGAAGDGSGTSPPQQQQQWIAQRLKVRAMKVKAWQRLHPAGGGWGLFGLHTVPPDAKEVVLTEGEFDCMAVYQATGRPAISLPNGCRSLPPEVLPLLERFERIYLWMDSDAPGTEGAEKFAHKLGIKRTYIVRPLPTQEGGSSSSPPAKDANEALLRGLDLEAMVRASGPLPDKRIVRFHDLRPLVFQELREKDKYEGLQVPSLPKLMGLLKGIRKGEMTVVSGPTGAGKTTLLSQMSLELANSGFNTLWGSFEIKNVRLVRKMLQQFNSAPLPLADAQSLDAVADRFQQLPLHFMRFHGSTNIDEVMDAMEYCTYVYDLSLVVLDNLQFMVSMTSSSSRQGGGGSSLDRFYHMDIAIERFRRFASEKNVHVMLVVHPRKESDQQRLGIASISGTAKATQDADNVLIVQRHDGKHYLDLRKNRFDGALGIVPLSFSPHNQRLVESGSGGEGKGEEEELARYLSSSSSSPASYYGQQPQWNGYRRQQQQPQTGGGGNNYPPPQVRPTNK